MNRRAFLGSGLAVLAGLLFPKHVTPQTSEKAGGLYQVADKFERGEDDIDRMDREPIEQALLDMFWAVHEKATKWMPTPYVYEVFVAVRPENEEDTREQATWCIEMPLSALEDL